MKAKIKLSSELPPEYRCCETAVLAQEPFEGMVIDVEPSDITWCYPCSFCGREFPKNVPHFRAFIRSGVGSLIPASCIDIDEGGVN